MYSIPWTIEMGLQIDMWLRANKIRGEICCDFQEWNRNFSSIKLDTIWTHEASDCSSHLDKTEATSQQDRCTEDRCAIYKDLSLMTLFAHMCYTTTEVKSISDIFN